MIESVATEVAQQMANEQNKDFVLIMCKKKLCNILSYENFQLSGKTRYYKKITPNI